MTSRRALVLALAVLAPLVAQVACWSSNGTSPEADVRDAGDLQPNNGDDDDTTMPPLKDAGARRDAGKVTPPDAAVVPPEVHLDEIYVDIDNLGDGAEFVELRAPAGARVDDLYLRILDRTGKVKYKVAVGDPGATVGSSGTWVVGGALTFKLGVKDRVDQPITISNWGLDESRGAVQLLRGTTLLEVVGWSDGTGPALLPPPSSPPTETGTGSPAAVPTIAKTPGKPAHSIGRRPDSSKSGDDAANFCSMVASPGAAQSPCD